MLTTLTLKKGHDRRIRSGHPWVFSNEIDTVVNPIKSYSPGQEVLLCAHDKTVLGVAYVNPHSLIAARLFSRNPEHRLDTEFFLDQLRLALALRERLFDRPFYRLAFSEADGLPGLVIDRFDQDCVIQVNTAGIDAKTTQLVEAVSSLLPGINSILLRNDSQVREQEGLERFVRPALGTPPEEIAVEENGVSFIAPLLKGQKTGWFFDHRLNRARLRQYVNSKSVLDVFSYVGGFGIQAAAFGASQVDCIESSSFAGEYIARNAQANHAAGKVRVICEDAFDAMKNLLREQRRYEVIVIDPPAFVKKFKDRKEGLLAYQRINEIGLKLLAPGGILVSCSCSMHVSMEDLMEMMQRIAYRTNSRLQVLERGHQGPDHPVHIAIPESDYLKALILRKID